MLTVMTPTYNRAHTLADCYRSLCAQTDQRFTWMIIDDGSSDHTKEAVQKWIDEKIISIIYLEKENGGKGSALNMGIDHLSTPYAACLDSDDTFYPDTVELVLKELETVKDDQKCCGVLAIRTNPDGTVMGGKEIPKDWKRVRAADIFMKLEFTGELICFYKSDILKQFRFPSFEGEKFFSPAWMQYEVSRNHYFKPSHSRLCCCDYLAEGLTRNIRRVCVQNPRCYESVKKQSFEFADTTKLIIKHGIMYDCACILSKNKKWLKDAPKKGWALLLMPMAWIAYLRMFRKYK